MRVFKTDAVLDDLIKTPGPPSKTALVACARATASEVDRLYAATVPFYVAAIRIDIANTVLDGGVPAPHSASRTAVGKTFAETALEGVNLVDADLVPLHGAAERIPCADARGNGWLKAPRAASSATRMLGHAAPATR